MALHQEEVSMAATKKKTGLWQPRNEITRNSEVFVYVGDGPRTKRLALKHETEYFHEQGRKCVFVSDKNDPTVFCMYASKKFYPAMCKTQYPSLGKHDLRRGPTW
jgi:hypothetical protein